MNGELMFCEKKCYFTFENFELKIYCLNGEAKDLFWENVNGVLFERKKDIPFSRLEGQIFGHKQETIIFYIYTHGYGYYGDLSKEKIILTINVSRYLVVHKKVSQNNCIAFGSKQFHRFLNLVPVYNIAFDHTSKIGEASYNRESVDDKATLKYKNNNYIIHPCPFISTDGIEIDFSPQLIVEMDKIIDEITFIEIADNLIIFFQIVFMRENVFPDTVLYYLYDKEIELFYNKGTKYINEEENLRSSLFQGNISWKAVAPVFQNIMDDIFNGIVSNKFLGKDSQERTWYSYEKVSSCAAFFESVYDLIYGNIVKHKSSSQEAINTIKSALNSIRVDNNKTLNNKIDFLINQLEHVPLSSKIQKVFKDYEECLSVVKRDFKLTNYTDDEIGLVCAKTRNDTDHGNNENKFDVYKATCFSYLNCSIYAMLMRRWGLDDQTISVQLHNLYLVNKN